MDFEFINEAVKRFDEDENIKPAFIAAVEEMSRELAAMNINDDYKPYMTVCFGDPLSVLGFLLILFAGFAQLGASRCHCSCHHRILHLQRVPRSGSVREGNVDWAMVSPVASTRQCDLAILLESQDERPVLHSQCTAVASDDAADSQLGSSGHHQPHDPGVERCQRQNPGLVRCGIEHQPQATGHAGRPHCSVIRWFYVQPHDVLGSAL